MADRTVPTENQLTELLDEGDINLSIRSIIDFFLTIPVAGIWDYYHQLPRDIPEHTLAILTAALIATHLPYLNNSDNEGLLSIVFRQTILPHIASLPIPLVELLMQYGKHHSASYNSNFPNVGLSFVILTLLAARDSCSLKELASYYDSDSMYFRFISMLPGTILARNLNDFLLQLPFNLFTAASFHLASDEAAELIDTCRRLNDTQQRQHHRVKVLLELGLEAEGSPIVSPVETERNPLPCDTTVGGELEVFEEHLPKIDKRDFRTADRRIQHYESPNDWEALAEWRLGPYNSPLSLNWEIAHLCRLGLLPSDSIANPLETHLHAHIPVHIRFGGVAPTIDADILYSLVLATGKATSQSRLLCSLPNGPYIRGINVISGEISNTYICQPIWSSRGWVLLSSPSLEHASRSARLKLPIGADTINRQVATEFRLNHLNNMKELALVIDEMHIFTTALKVFQNPEQYSDFSAMANLISQFIDVAE